MAISSTATILKELRKQKGFTQIELSQQLKIDQTTVSKWELGKAIPDTKILIELAKLFDVSTDYLLGISTFYYPDKIKKSAELTSSEQTLLANYKRLPEDLRRLAETYVKKLVSLHETSIPTRIAPAPKTEPQQMPKKKTGISPA